MALRGLTDDQKESINSMIGQLDEMKRELETANKTVDESIETVRKIKFQCAQWVLIDCIRLTEVVAA